MCVILQIVYYYNGKCCFVFVTKQCQYMFSVSYYDNLCVLHQFKNNRASTSSPKHWSSKSSLESSI